MYSMRGDDLPSGTVVYYVTSSINEGISHRIIDHYLYHITYVFDLKDGLWASAFTRRLWELRPYRHPHCTLFAILYKNLEI